MDQEKASLEKLDRSIKDAKRQLRNKNKPITSSNNMGIVSRICTELLAGIVIGCFVGYYLDLWLDTKPFLFIVCFFLGVAASGLNIYRIIQKSIDPKDIN